MHPIPFRENPALLELFVLLQAMVIIAAAGAAAVVSSLYQMQEGAILELDRKLRAVASASIGCLQGHANSAAIPTAQWLNFASSLFAHRLVSDDCINSQCH